MDWSTNLPIDRLADVLIDLLPAEWRIDPTDWPIWWPNNRPTTNQSTYWLSDRLVDRSIVRPTDRLIDQPTDRLTNQPTDWPTNRLIDQPTDWLSDRLTHRSIDRLTHRSIDRLTDRQTDWPIDWPTDRPTDQPTDWLTVWPTDWPINSPTNRLSDRSTTWLADWVTKGREDRLMDRWTIHKKKRKWKKRKTTKGNAAISRYERHLLFHQLHLCRLFLLACLVDPRKYKLYMNVVRILIKYAFMKFCSLLLHCSSFSRLRDHFLHILVLTINNLKSLMECFTVCVYLKYEKLRLMFQDVFPSLSTAVPFLFRIFSSSFNLCMFAI